MRNQKELDQLGLEKRIETNKIKVPFYKKKVIEEIVINEDKIRKEDPYHHYHQI